MIVLKSKAQEDIYKILGSYGTPLFFILLLEYLTRDFTEVLLMVPFSRKFILKLLNTCEL